MRSKAKTTRKGSKAKAPSKDSKASEMAAMRNSVPKPKPGDRVRK